MNVTSWKAKNSKPGIGEDPQALGRGGDGEDGGERQCDERDAPSLFAE